MQTAQKERYFAVAASSATPVIVEDLIQVIDPLLAACRLQHALKMSNCECRG